MLITRQARVPSRGRFCQGKFAVPATIAGQLELRSPHNLGEIIGVFGYGVDDVEVAVASARAAQRRWQGLRLDERLDALGRIEAALVPRLAELLTIMQRELGRPLWECEREVEGLVPRLRGIGKLARSTLVEGKPRAAVRTLQRALGVVAVLSPVMFPLGTAHATLLSALVAGNTVVWKPSPLVAASAQIYAEVIAAAGLPPGVFNLIQGDDAVGARLAQADGIDGVVFVGSAQNARALRQAMAHRLDVKTIVHVGTKNAAVVLADANVEITVPEIVQGTFATAGQRCTAIGRVLVEASVLESFVEALLAAIGQLSHEGNARHAAFGPLFTPARLETFLGRLTAAEEAGVQFLLEPTLSSGRATHCRVGASVCLVDDTTTTDLRTGELFGPNLVIEAVPDLDTATTRLARGNSLYASLFSSTPRQWSRFCQGVGAGAALWNHSPGAVSGQVAFAAAGREAANRGAAALLAMTRQTAWCEAPTASPLAMPMADLQPVQSKRAKRA